MNEQERLNNLNSNVSKWLEGLGISNNNEYNTNRTLLDVLDAQEFPVNSYSYAYETLTPGAYEVIFLDNTQLKVDPEGENFLILVSQRSRVSDQNFISVKAAGLNRDEILSWHNLQVSLTTHRNAVLAIPFLETLPVDLESNDIANDVKNIRNVLNRLNNTDPENLRSPGGISENEGEVIVRFPAYKIEKKTEAEEVLRSGDTRRIPTPLVRSVKPKQSVTKGEHINLKPREIKPGREMSRPRSIEEFADRMLAILGDDNPADFTVVQQGAARYLKSYLDLSITNGLLHLFTSSGKTYLLQAIAKATGARTLTIVPGKELGEQVLEEAEALDPQADTTLITGKINKNRRREGKDQTVMTDRLFFKLLKRGEIKPTDYDLLVFDEVHEGYLSKSRWPVVEKLVNETRGTFPVIVGKSATPFYNNLKSAAILLENTFFTADLHRGVETESVADFGVYHVLMNGLELPDIELEVDRDGQLDYSAHQINQLFGEENNFNYIAGTIAELINMTALKGEYGQTMVFMSGIQNSQRLAEDLNKRFQDVEVEIEGVRRKFKAVAMWGDMEERLRTEYLKQLKNGDIDVVVNSQLFERGLNLPPLIYGILAKPYRSGVKVEQRLGRFARKFRGRVKHIFELVYPLKSPQRTADMVLGRSYTREGIFKGELLKRFAIGRPTRIKSGIPNFRDPEILVDPILIQQSNELRFASGETNEAGEIQTNTEYDQPAYTLNGFLFMVATRQAEAENPYSFAVTYNGVSRLVEHITEDDKPDIQNFVTLRSGNNHPERYMTHQLAERVVRVLDEYQTSLEEGEMDINDMRDEIAERTRTERFDEEANETVTEEGWIPHPSVINRAIKAVVDKTIPERPKAILKPTGSYKTVFSAETSEAAIEYILKIPLAPDTARSRYDLATEYDENMGVVNRAIDTVIEKKPELAKQYTDMRAQTGHIGPHLEGELLEDVRAILGKKSNIVKIAEVTKDENYMTLDEAADLLNQELKKQDPKTVLTAQSTTLRRLIVALQENTSRFDTELIENLDLTQMMKTVIAKQGSPATVVSREFVLNILRNAPNFNFAPVNLLNIDEFIREYEKRTNRTINKGTLQKRLAKASDESAAPGSKWYRSRETDKVVQHFNFEDLAAFWENY